MAYVLAVLLAASSMVSSHELVRPGLEVTLVLDPDASVTAADLRAIGRELAVIWSPVIDLHVSLPGSPPRTGAVDAVRIVITTRTLQGRDSGGLGWTEFVDGVPQSTLTISTTALMRMIARDSWQGRSLDALPPVATRLAIQHGLARAAAHEVGHYLLRSTTHARTGLMRANFSLDDVMDTRAEATRLAPDVAGRVQSLGLVARTGEATPASGAN